MIVLLAVLCVGGMTMCIRSCGSEPESEGVAEVVPAVHEKSPFAGIKHWLPTTVRAPHRDKKSGNLADTFDDLNDLHLAAATRVGITPISSSRDIMSMRGPIELISSDQNLLLDTLTHSYPYLVPEAAKLLRDIGQNFAEELKMHGNARYRLKVTSLLRTRESVKRLQRGNKNSTENSAHLYGTTFDISHRTFAACSGNPRQLTDEQLKQILADVLLELRNQGRCLVKYEIKQACFHITTTGK